MKILKMKVKWNEDLMNKPSLQLLVDRIPALDELRFERKGNLFYAEKEGYVQFFAGDPEKPGNGFGGREFTLKMKSYCCGAPMRQHRDVWICPKCGSNVVKDKDLEILTLIGPFSSRAGVMNAAKFGPCVDVDMTESDVVYDKGYMFTPGSVMVQMIKDNWYKLQDLNPEKGSLVYIVEVHVGGDITWIPSADKDVVMKLSEKQEEFKNSNFDISEIKATGGPTVESLSQVQSDVLKSKPQKVICNRADECRFEGCEHKKRHVVSYISICCNEAEICIEAPQFGKTKCIPYVEEVDVLENFLQKYYEGEDIDDLALRKLVSKEMQYNALVRWVLAFLECPVKSITKPNSDPPNRVVYDDDELKVMVIEIEKILKILEKD